MEILSDREKLILEAVVLNFISTANPVASSFIAGHTNLSFSPATIRNVMSTLEEKGYIYQPHTSAGRVPTSAGYRYYVNQLMKKTRISQKEKERIRKVLIQTSGDFEFLLKESTRILAQVSRQLGIIISPYLAEGIFHRLEISRLSDERLLLILSIKSGLVKTIMLEINSMVKDNHLEVLRDLLNERLNGLKLKEIRSKFKEIVKDIQDEETGLLRVFVRSANNIFNFGIENDVYLTGTHNILRQPEFINNTEIPGVVEILENNKVIIHLLNESTFGEDLSILIGDEIGEKKMSNCGLIIARYKLDRVSGSIGLIGPMRMDYSHLVPLVEFTANLLSDSFN